MPVPIASPMTLTTVMKRSLRIDKKIHSNKAFELKWESEEENIASNFSLTIIKFSLCSHVFPKEGIFEHSVLEHFAIECCETRTKVLTTADQKKREHLMRTQNKNKQITLSAGKESYQFAIGCSVESVWLIKCRKFS